MDRPDPRPHRPPGSGVHDYIGRLQFQPAHRERGSLFLGNGVRVKNFDRQRDAGSPEADDIGAIAVNRILSRRADESTWRQFAPLYPGLTDEEVSELMASLHRKYPQATRFGEMPYQESKADFDRRLHALIQSQLIGVTDQDRADYDKAYGAWERNARDSFVRLHTLLNAKYRWLSFTLQIKNVGNASAEHLLLELSTHGGVLMCVSTEPGDPEPYRITQKLRDSPMFPSPPDPPRPTSAFEEALQGLRDQPFNSDDWLRQHSHFPDLRVAVERDRYALEISESEDKMRQTWSLRCQEFRHGREPKAVRCWILAAADSVAGKTRLHIRATASNVRAPFERHIPIDLQDQLTSAVTHALQWQIDKTKKWAEPEESEEDHDQGK